MATVPVPIPPPGIPPDIMNTVVTIGHVNPMTVRPVIVIPVFIIITIIIVTIVVVYEIDVTSEKWHDGEQ
jgi:hypothetical protein